MYSFYEHFYFTDEPDFRVHVDTNITFRSHLHMQLELIVVKSGEIYVTVDNERRLLRRDEACIVQGNQIHSYETEFESEMYVLVFSPHMAPEFSKSFKKNSLVTSFIGKADNIELVRHCFEELIKYDELGENKLALLGNLYLLLSEILPKTEFIEGKRLETSTLQKILYYIECNFENDISLDDISRDVGISKTYISKLFSQKVGCSFKDYLKSIRINKAIKLLSEGKEIIDVTYECGFNSHRTFYRAFKELLGTTPNNIKLDMIK